MKAPDHLLPALEKLQASCGELPWGDPVSIADLYQFVLAVALHMEEEESVESAIRRVSESTRLQAERLLSEHNNGAYLAWLEGVLQPLVSEPGFLQTVEEAAQSW